MDSNCLLLPGRTRQVERNGSQEVRLKRGWGGGRPTRWMDKSIAGLSHFGELAGKDVCIQDMEKEAIAGCLGASMQHPGVLA